MCYFLHMNKSADTSFSDHIRDRAVEAYVKPARRSGKTQLSIAVPDLMRALPEFSKGRQSIFCTALKTKSFLKKNGLSLERMEAPLKGRGTNVVYHYRLNAAPEPERKGPLHATEAAQLAERLLAPLQGLLAQEIAAHGGAEGYMKWVRSDAPTS